MAASLMRPKEPKTEIDKTLTLDGYAADAKSVGDELTTVRHKLECGEGETHGEIEKWTFVRVNYKYQHNITPIPVSIHYKTNIANTALTIQSYDKEGFTVGVFNTPYYVGFLWIAVEPD